MKCEGNFENLSRLILEDYRILKYVLIIPKSFFQFMYCFLQKISHPVQMVCLFKETGVPIPLTYREIESTLKIVSALLKHYQEQTKYNSSIFFLAANLRLNSLHI